MKFFKKFLSRKFIIIQEIIIISCVFLYLGKLPPTEFVELLKFIALIYVGGNILVHPNTQQIVSILKKPKNTTKSNNTILD